MTTNTAPTVTLSSDTSTLRNGEIATITLLFSHAPVDFSLSDLVARNGSLRDLTASNDPLVYTVKFTPVAGLNGAPGGVSVTNGSYFDLGGNSGAGAASPDIGIHTLSPSVAITSDAAWLHAGQHANISFTFSSLPQGFSRDDIVVNGGALGALNYAGGNVYTAVFTPGPNVSAAASITVTSGSYTDMLGNPGGGGATPTLVVDTIAPTLEITSNATALKKGETAVITFTFSEAPIGFTASDVTVSGGRLSAFSPASNPLVYTAIFTPADGVASGLSGIAVAASTYGDIAGNSGLQANAAQMRIDTLAPTATAISVQFSADQGSSATDLITNDASQQLTGTLNAPLAAGETVQFSLDNGSTWQAAVAAPGAFGWLSDTQTLTGSDTLQVRVVDEAGNTGPVFSAAYVLDRIDPTATIGTITFSADTGSSVTDLVTRVAGQTISGNLSAALGPGEVVEVSLDDGAHWKTASTTGMGWSLDHTLTGSGILVARVVDAAGNAGPSFSRSYQFDQSSPTVSISSNVATANGVTPAIITFTFSEPPVGFSLDNVLVFGGELKSLAATSSPSVYTATFTPQSGVANGSTSIGVSSYTDAAGNAGVPAHLSSLRIDTVAPVATVVAASFSNDSGLDGDLITNRPDQTISGTLSSALAAGDQVQVSLDGGDTWATASVIGTEWKLAGQTLSGTSTLKVRVTDDAGNFSTAYSASYAIDTQAPTVAISSDMNGTLGRGQSATLTITLSDPGVLTLADIVVSGGALSDFSGSGTVYTVKLTPPANSTVPLTVSVAGQLFSDVAGNASAAATPLVLQVNTMEPVTPPPVPVPVPTMVDGVAISTSSGPGGSTLITIPVITPDRPDTPGTPSRWADIPLLTSASGQTLLMASVPTGVGLQAEGFSGSTMGQAALAQLIARIEQVAGGNAALTDAAQAFHAGLRPNEAVTVQILKPVAGAGFNAGTPLVITGSSVPAGGRQAIVLDAGSLPAGASVQLDHVDFAAVVGAVRIVGGAGQNVVIGDGAAQYIVLGPDDDILHGGGGNDTVGSRGGDDQVYGDAGDDIVFGGAGNDLLSGGTGSDRLNGGTGFDVALQEGKRSDYTLALEGAGVKLTHIASGVSDWLVDVEQLRFETGPSLTLAHSAAEEAAAFLFQQWMGRDLTQAEGAVIQTLDGLSALQVADLFMLVFPQQAGGRTAQQLLEGLADAGAIRVDAERDSAFVGAAGNDTIAPTMGLAWSVDGGAGVDTVLIPASFAQMHIEANATGFTLQRMSDGAMLELVNVERLTLSDTQLALDLDGPAGQAARLLGALGGAALLDNKPLVGEMIRALDGGMSAQGLAQLGLQVLGAQTPGQVAQLLWTHVVGSAATSAQLRPFVDLMDQGITGGELAVLAGNLELNTARIDLVGLAATGIEFA